VSRLATITLLNDVKCQITGLLPDHHQHFWASYGLHTPNYFFNPEYTLGTWDGKIRYYHKDGLTYIYLLDQIIPTLTQLGYEIKITDNRIGKFVELPTIDQNYFYHIINDETDEPYVLHQHQVDVVNTLCTQGSGLAIAATGAGKTLICAAIADLYVKKGLRVILIVPSQDLIEQTRDDFTALKVRNGEYSGTNKEIEGHTCVISTWQALQNVPQLMSQFQVVIVDECHGAKGKELMSLLTEHGANIAHRFGVTGSLPKPETDKMSINVALGQVHIEIPASLLISLGILATLDIHIQQLDEDLTAQYNEFLANNPKIEKIPTYTQYKDQYFPEYAAEKSFLQKYEYRKIWMAEKISNLKKQGNTFVLVDGVSFGKQLAQLIPGARFIHGADKKKVRKEIYKSFRDNDNLCIIATVNIASTGINIKRIYNLVLIDLGKSFTRVIQCIGRGLRKAPDKDHVDVFDICSDFKYGKTHLAERIKYYKEANYPHTKEKIKYKDQLIEHL